MNENTTKNRNETWDDYVWRMMEERSENSIEYDELYEILFNEQISITEARKRLYGVKQSIIARRDNDGSLPDNYLEKETFELKADGSHELVKFITACEEDMKSPDRIMEILGYDYLEWELVSSRHNRWNVYSKADGKQLLYSLRAVVKPRQVQISSEKITEIINSLEIKSKSLKSHSYSEGDFMLEIPMMDVHFNKVSDKRITGFHSDSETIKTEFLSVVKYFLEKAKGKNIEKIIFPIGQDYFNSEAGNMTTAGTPQDNDLPPDLMFEKGTDLLFQAIEMCRKIAPVFIPFVKGNHDTNIAYYACSSLNRMYKYSNVEGVEFDILPKRKYIEYGNCLIGYTHGNKERTRIEKENIMQNEAKEAWGRTCFREWHVGHEHHEEVKELGGIKYRKINSITANDNWHYESGYVGALRMAQAFLWHKNMGLLDIYNCPIIDIES